MGLNTTGNLVVGGTMELSGSTIQVSGADLVFSGSVLAKNDDVQSNYYTKSQVDSVTDDLQSQLDNIPAGSDAEIQFNSSGSLSSDPEFTWSNPVLQLGLGPSITLNTTSGIDMSFVTPPGGDYKITRSILCSGVGINLVNATSASGGDLVEVTDDLIINTLTGNADQFVSLTSAGKLQASGLDSTDFVNVTGDTMTGSLTLASGSDLTLSGDQGDNIRWGSKANAGWNDSTSSLRILAQEGYGLLLNVNGTSNGIAIDSDGDTTVTGELTVDTINNSDGVVITDVNGTLQYNGLKFINSGFASNNLNSFSDKSNAGSNLIITGYSKNSSGDDIGYTNIQLGAKDVTDGSEAGQLIVQMYKNGSPQSVFSINSVEDQVTLPTFDLGINQGSIIMSTSNAPSSSTDVGAQGTITWDTNYIYVATGTNTWKRAALSSW